MRQISKKLTNISYYIFSGNVRFLVHYKKKEEEENPFNVSYYNSENLHYCMISFIKLQ